MDKQKLYDIIFEADTKSGKLFDIVLIWSILISVCIVLIESINELPEFIDESLIYFEWGFTILFTIEYLLRIYVIKKPLKYIFSFFGIVDLLAILPSYLSFFIPGSQSLIVIRILRLLRIFRLFKLSQLLTEASVLKKALIASREKIFVFLFTVLMLVVIIGSLMYVIEGEKNGFRSIPESIYWTIVTLSTVGYGDIVPQTIIGKFLASIVMILGYGIIAVPTGIVTVEIAEQSRKQITTQVCQNCLKEGHDKDAVHCKFCGHELNPNTK